MRAILGDVRVLFALLLVVTAAMVIPTLAALARTPGY